MNNQSILRVVLDTNVVFEGLTRQGGTCGLIIEAWFVGLIHVCISDALAYEYVDVFSRKLSAQKWERIQPILGNFLTKAEQTSIYFSWRPSSPDPGDELVIDCAMNANATLVTANLRDFRLAQKELGLRVMTPLDLVTRLLA